MRRLLLWVVGCLAATVPSIAHEPVRFDLPFSVEHGYYTVWVDTPAGPRRFLFDTGFSISAISESLCRELRAKSVHSVKVNDYHGQRASSEMVKVDSLGLGPLVFRNKTMIVLADTSFLVRCFRFEGVVGCDMMHKLAVRLPNADSTISFASNLRALDPPARKRSVPLFRHRTCPYIPITLGAGKQKFQIWALFDTGASGYFDLTSRQKLPLHQFADDIERTEGLPSSVGLSERVERSEIIRGRIPAFTIAGTTIADMPVGSREGYTHVIGNKLLQWGGVILDFKSKRFWFLPPEECELRVQPQELRNITLAWADGRLVVGQVWDEALKGVVEPGDRIVLLGTIPVDSVDICTFLRKEIRLDRFEFTVERKDGSRVTVPINNL